MIKNWIINTILLLFSLSLVLVVAEVIARAVTPSLDRHYVWPPNMDAVFWPQSRIMPGVQGYAHVITNLRGIRGDELSDDQNYRILAVGGSTTECLYLDQGEAWPMLLQEKLSGWTEKNIWVGNIGRSGHNSRAHLLQVKHLLSELPEIDMVLLLLGLNELTLHLSSGAGYSPYTDAQKATAHKRALYRIVIEEDEYYKRTGLWRLYQKLTTKKSLPVNKQLYNDKRGINYSVWRQWRLGARKIIDDMPDLSLAFEEYEHNLNQLIDIAEANSTRIVFMTQPSIWRDDLSDEEKAMLWYGWIGDRKKQPTRDFYSIDVLTRAMAQYNRKLLGVCTRRKVECIDLAQVVPKSLDSFYDDAHFNEQGSRMVADVAFEYLKHTSPFNNKGH